MNLNSKDDRSESMIVRLLTDAEYRAKVMRLAETVDGARRKFDGLRARLTGKPAPPEKKDEPPRGLAEAALDALFKDEPAPAPTAKKPEPEPTAPTTVGWLMLKSGEQNGKWFDLAPGEIRIGSAETCKIRIAGGDTVSGEHAAVRVTAQECKVSDLRSKSGTFVNDERLKSPHVLQEGDVLRIGVATMVFMKA